MRLSTAMVDHPDSRYGEPDEEPPASAQPNEGGVEASDQEQGASVELANVEVASLKRKLALYLKGLDAVREQAAALERESHALAESVRRQAEVKAREIIRQAAAEAELLELRARLQAEEMRAREAARLWTRTGLAMEAPKAGNDTTALNQSASMPPSDGEREAIDDAGMAEEVGGARAAPVVAEEPPRDEEKTTSLEPESDPAASAGADEGAARDSSAPMPQGDDQQAASGDVQELTEQADKEATSEATAGGDQPSEEKAAGAEPDGGLVSGRPAEVPLAPDAPAQEPPLEVRQYPLRGPLNSISMAAIEQSVGRISGVLSAKVSASQDGGGILIVCSDDPTSTEVAIKRLHI